jgi:hypothetical protein
MTASKMGVGDSMVSSTQEKKLASSAQAASWEPKFYRVKMYVDFT